MLEQTLFATNTTHRLWKYAVIVSDTDGNLYVKDGDTRQNTREEALDYAASETTGKARGLIKEIDILGVWDMTDDAIRRNPAYDPTQTEVDYKRGYDNEIRGLMPLKRKRIENFRGQNSLELHPIPKDMLKDPNWREVLSYEWGLAHDGIANGGHAPSLNKYFAREYLVESFTKTTQADTNKFLLAAATGAGKETSTLALLVHLHDVKGYDNKRLNVAVATIPSTVSELMHELATVSGMEVDGYGFVDFSRIEVYIMKQWWDARKNDCSVQAKHMVSSRAKIVNTIKDIPKTHASGVVPVLFGGYHDIAQKSGDKLNTRYAGLEKRIGTLSIGEAHQLLSNADNKMWANLDDMYGAKCFKLFVTGTPYDFIYGNVAAEFFTADERALFTRNDLYRDKRVNPNSDFSAYPNFNYYGIDIEDVIAKLKEDPNWKDDAEGFTWAKLFTYDSTTKKFTYERTVLWLFKRMFGSNAFDENGDPLSVYNAPDLCDKAKQHIMVALPIGNKNASAETYIGALKSLLIQHGVFEGSVFDAYEDGLGDRKDDIAASAGRTLTLTCIKDCTGANIPELGCFVFLRNIGDSVKFFEQATGRVGRKYPGKTNCGVFIAELDQAMNIMVTIEEKISFERGHDFSTREIIEDTLANYNFFSGRNGSWEKLAIPDFASILEELNARGNYGINQCAFKTSAEEGFDLLFNNTVGTEGKKVDLTSNGNKGAKNGQNSFFEQLGLPFDNNNNPDENWHNMKLAFVAKCRFLAFIYGTETVAQCVDLVEQAIHAGDKEILEVIGKGVEYFPIVMQSNQVDVPYTNRWIQKFNDRKHDFEHLFEMLADPVHRNDNDFIAETNEVLHKIASTALSKLTKTSDVSVFDACGGRGGLIVYFIKEADKAGVSIDASKVYYNDVDPLMVTFFRVVNSNLALGIPEKNITCGDFNDDQFRSKYYANKKVDAVLINPPYNGKAALHQQFFNKCYEMLNPNGVMACMQPATTYFNKKTKQKDAVDTMQDILLTNVCEVVIEDPAIIENAGIQNDLSITYLIKTKKSKKVIDRITYKDGNVYSNVPLEDISMTQINPKLYASIRSKYNKFIKDNGNLEDMITKDPEVVKATLPKIRGTRPTDDDFYTFIPKVQSKMQALLDDEDSSFGVVVFNEEQVANVYDYLKSYMARFGLSFLKFSQNTANKEFAMVPLVDFDRSYTDQELYDLLGLTKAEVLEIKSVIADYYGR
jgi:16S rRNA G966 N2-methylase RsmD